MNPEKNLYKEFTAQQFDRDINHDILQEGLLAARIYASTECAIAVLSDLRTDRSYICPGEATAILGLDAATLTHETGSVWETEIFSIIHPDDLRRKHVEELNFFHFISRQPRNRQQRFYLASPLRMRTKSGQYAKMLHRIFYFTSGNAIRLALCLYGINPGIDSTLIINSVTGEAIHVDSQGCDRLLSERERSVLALVANGMKSKDIAEILCISPYTVNRHRQNILYKLQAANSTEAIRIARDLDLI